MTTLTQPGLSSLIDRLFAEADAAEGARWPAAADGRADPHTTMPPRNEATEAAISPRSARIAPTSIAAKTSPPTGYGNTSDQDEFAAALKLGGKLLNVLLEAHDLFVGIGIF